MRHVSFLQQAKGDFGKSKLDGREDEIKRLLALGVSKASIAKITGVGPPFTTSSGQEGSLQIPNPARQVLPPF